MEITTGTTRYVHPGRAYCDQPYHGTGDDAQANRWCEDYHRPRGPRSVEQLRRHPAADHTLACWAAGARCGGSCL